MKKVKLERTPPEAPTADPFDAPGPPGWQSPAAAPFPHQGSLAPHTYAAAGSRQMLGAVQQAHVQQVQTSLPMTSGSHQLQQQLQQVLSLFDGDTAAGLAAKESALTKLVMLVAGNMYTPFLQPLLNHKQLMRHGVVWLVPVGIS